MDSFRVRQEDKVNALTYYAKTTPVYEEVVHRGILKMFRDKERKVMLEFAALNEPGKTVIDVGTGAGFYALTAKAAGMYVTAVDAVKSIVDRLAPKVDEVLVADVEQLPPERTYDRVICAGVLDFVQNPYASVNNLCRLVAPGGKLIILCPRRGPGGLFYRVEKYFFGFRVNLYTPSWMDEMARAHGLELKRFAKPLPTNMAFLFEKPLSH